MAATCRLRRLTKVAYAAASLLGVTTAAFRTPTIIRVPVRSSLPGISPRISSYVTPPVSLTTLQLASDSPASATETRKLSKAKFDYDAVVKYFGALGIQCTLLFGFLSGLDFLVNKMALQVPGPANFALFYALSLKSRVFNPLANNSPKVNTLESDAASTKRIMPAWTPPGVVFPVMWLLVIAPLRALASTMVVAATSQYASWTIMTLMTHLSIGDVWNTINNVERRYGVSVVGLACVWLSKACAAYAYHRAVPRAGMLLALPLLWLTVASALIYSTWRINPDPSTGKPDPLYPTVGDKRTTFVWFQNSA
jgi:translocator protein